TGRTRDLVTLLVERSPLSRRIAGLWLELDEPALARDVIEKMIAGGTAAADMIELLERLAAHAGEARASDLLAAGHVRAGRIADAVRVHEAALAWERGASRAARVRTLVLLRLRESDVETVMATASAHIAGDARVAKAAWGAALRHAVSVKSSGAIV